ncbi:hypothetical protein, conserved [Babesia bigemina]|uniref:C3H1-type domain-containing protein n=1 Tax=Babesia bigemina TaxID=5866 RepID=A0A061BK72_BABBI|nr:hypothetical protein, conserved [Babesia bigemina]CDR71847.1 hypothetical protein, conserved [Babesia bigemina]|eukprot:XP_012770790.1 hypothetical protein, conserved [Babesia bigemina]
MGFLSGVLEAVKDENEVTTYDNYITENDKKLEKVLNTLTKQIGSGREGLAASVGAVKGWLEGYERKLNEKIKKVKNPINNLENELERQKQNIEKLKNKEYDNAKNSDLADCIRDLDKLTEQCKESSRSLKSVDYNFQKQLKPHVEKICQAAETFLRNAVRDHDDLLKVCNNLNDELGNLQAAVISHANVEGEQCITHVKKEFEEKVKTPIQGVKNRLYGLNSELERWYTLAKQVLTKGTSKCDEILGHVKDKNQSQKWRAVEIAASTLKSRADALRELVIQAKRQLTVEIQNALSQVVVLDRAVRTGLKNTKDFIKEAMKNYVSNKLLAEIQTQIKSIEGDPRNGLTHIMEEVKKYAMKFKQDGEHGFESIVKYWINDILVMEPVKGWLEKYFEEKSRFKNGYEEWNDKGKSSSELTLKLAALITKHLTAEINAAVKNAQHVIANDTISNQVNAVQFSCDKFASQLGTRIKDNNHSLLIGVAKAINDAAKGNDKFHNSRELTDAVESILHQLVSVAKKTEEAIKSFTCNNSDMSADVDAALKVATHLKTALTTSVITSTVPIPPDDMEPFDLKTNVEGIIHGILNKEIGMENKISDKIAKLNERFELYGELIRQDNVPRIAETSAKLIGKLDEGKFPTMIKGIEDKVNGVNHLGRVIDGSTSDSSPVNVNGQVHIDTFKQLCDQVNSELKSLCDSVKELVDNDADEGSNGLTPSTKRGVKNLLNDLQKMLDTSKTGTLYGLPKHLQAIHDEVKNTVIGDDHSFSGDRAPQTLAEIVKAANEFHTTTIKQKVDQCISDITAKVKQEVTEKIKNLKNAALAQFTKRKTAELEELKNSVNVQKNIIDNIIFTNQTTGLKGLMNTIGSNLQAHIDPLIYVDFTKLSNDFRCFVNPLFTYITSQLTPSPSSQLVADLQTRTYALLSHLHENKRTFTFDSGFRSLLHGLTSALSTFNAAAFANPHHPQLLDALKAGMRGLVKEMEKAYVNRYCGCEGITWSKVDDKFDPTDDAKRCAKVLMSCLPMLLNDLSKVKERCANKGEWSKLKINSHPKNKLGPFLKSCGYSVASDVPLQDGELQNSSKMKGENIHKIVADVKAISPDEHVPQCRSPKKTENFDMIDYIICLCDHLHEYYRVNHYATFTSKKHPSTINDMLQWLSGLPFNTVYSDLALNGFEDLFEEPEDTDAKAINVDILVEVEKERSLDAYPEKITVAKLSGVLTEVCHHAEETLISLLGHGHGDGIYACDFNTNSAKLTYPSDPSKCLDLLFEVISRVYNQLFFLFKQCSYSTKLGGWYDCWYGQGVGGSAWNCNTLQCPGQRGDQKAGQEHNQKCNQSCDQTAECGLKSPLQSFLEDGLPGFLPHPYSKSNCKPTCTAPGHFGKVCITPMGFNDISGMASRRQQGRHITDVLREFCGSEHAPLSRLCGLLTCLLTRPPQTLGDMFAFYYNFLNGWYSAKLNGPREKHREIAFSLAVKDANFKNSDNPLEVHSMFENIHHRASETSTHPKGDLFSLVACDQPMAENTYCGRYLQPCGQHIWTVFSKEHADKYLSWIVYLTETFYDLLKMLYDDCNNKCGQDHSKCNRTSCAVDCKTKLPSKSKIPTQDRYHDSKCRTIVTCKSTLPTFCRYGFVFDSPQSLSGEYGDDKKRTCKDFCRALNRVLSDDKKVNDVLAKLKFETIPTFLWNIRSKFFWLTVALWLLSFLYLLHIMVIRLDLLHIKSHLHSPSSHRIAAQSLLAAARVNKLGRVFYLQP